MIIFISATYLYTNIPTQIIKEFPTITEHIFMCKIIVNQFPVAWHDQFIFQENNPFHTNKIQ